MGHFSEGAGIGIGIYHEDLAGFGLLMGRKGRNGREWLDS